MRIFYDKTIDPKAKNHQLSEDESKHIVRVLRLGTGDQIAIVDGNGHAFECRIISDNSKKCLVEIETILEEKPKEYEIHIAVSPTKQSERLEWFVEKATEIGITEISLIRCKNSERVKFNHERLEKKAISALKQSKRLFLPKINKLRDFNEFLLQNKSGLIAHCYKSEKKKISELFQPTSCPVLIGPEGDFTQEEVNLALENGYKTITLGENRLRTETAALFACMQAKIKIDQ